MAVNKWRVQRHQLPWKNYDGEWFAVPTVDSENQGMYFPTHAEAFAYADERSRTIEVTLPRDPEAREVARAGEWASWKGDGWAITSNDPERAALHVLAYYYRKARA